MPLRLAGGALVKWLGGGTVAALLFGGAGWIYHQWQTARLDQALTQARQEAAQLRVSRDQWRQAAEVWADQVLWQQDQARADAQAREALAADLAQVDEAYRELHGAIDQAGEDEDGPVAPVLRRTLEALP